MANWTPGTITTSLWLDASDASTITVSAGAASQWTDKSGNGRHATQGTAEYRPAVVTAALNGLDGLAFDGVDDFLSCGDTLDIGLDNQTIFVVGSLASTGDQALIAKSLYASAAGRYGILRSGADLLGLYSWDASGTVSTPGFAFSTALPRVISTRLARGSSPQHTLWLDGATVATITPAIESYNLQTAYRLLLGAYNNATDTGQVMYLNGRIYEVIVLNRACLINERQIIEGYLAWKWGLQANLASDHPYKSEAPVIAAIAVAAGLTVQYGDAPSIAAAIVGQYSLILEQAIIGRYSDAPRLLSGLVARYGDAALVQTALVGRYGDLVQVAAALEGRYHLMHARAAALVGEYAICGIELLASLVGRYDLRERDEIIAAIEGYYSLLQSETIQEIARPVLIGGVAVRWSSVSWTISEDSYLIEATIILRDPGEFGSIAKMDTVEIDWDDVTYHLFVATKLRSRSISGEAGTAEYSAEYTIIARSLTAGLDAPYALPITRSWPATTLASTIAADLIAPLSDIITLDFRLEDWLQPGGTFFVTDEAPLEGLRKLAAIVGGIVQTSPGNAIILRTVDAIPPSNWATTAPAWTIEDSGLFSDSESEAESNAYNVITVTNQGESNRSTRFEIEDISDYRKRVRGYRVPWHDFALTTSGGAWVTIEDGGVVEEQVVDELVEFIDGAASASKPIYSQVSAVWLQASLGTITAAEDGSLTAAVAGNSLAKITYTTRCHVWIGASDRSEEVQFYEVDL